MLQTNEWARLRMPCEILETEYWQRYRLQTVSLLLFGCVILPCCKNQNPANPNTPQNATQPSSGSPAEDKTQSHSNDHSSIFVLNRPLSNEDLERFDRSEIKTVQINSGVASNISDQWIEYLPEGLTQLKIRQVQINDRLLEEILATQPSLTTLNLPSCQLTQKAALQIADFQELRNLRVGGKCFDDTFFHSLKSASSLRSVHLIGPKLTDRSLEILKSASQIKTFYLDDCKLSDDAWESLFAARPDLHVHVDQLHHDRDSSGN